ncbi:cation transporter [Phaeobacter marinintestinus]|uniref:cation transporter n=1 Tax=Falsiphaeobacter marinintestinus TaxID=1492905 RepID=UPI0011B39F34|nr:cation transporter [Phaeobacter marinintestinus]
MDKTDPSIAVVDNCPVYPLVTFRMKGLHMDTQRIKQLESRSLLIAMWGNLFMGAAGILAAVLSNSTAIMMDGLFSLVGFTAAFLGRKISRRVDAGPDRLRPMGYAADEALFSTFRALSLLGLVMFAMTSAGVNIYKYLQGEATPELSFGPLFVYFVVIGGTSFLLWALHRYTWSRTGKVSEILRLEAKASLFDGIITAAAGAGLGAVYFFQDGFLAPIAPIGDSIVVLILCLTAIGQYRRNLVSGMGELVGATANPKAVAAARRAIRPSVADDGGVVTDLSVMKLGRTHLVSVYYNPQRPIDAGEADQLNLRMIHDVREALSGADVILIISEHPRRWPDELDPF